MKNTLTGEILHPPLPRGWGTGLNLCILIGDGMKKEKIKHRLMGQRRMKKEV
jgi:hypothetical protein